MERKSRPSVADPRQPSWESHGNPWGPNQKKHKRVLDTFSVLMIFRMVFLYRVFISLLLTHKGSGALHPKGGTMRRYETVFIVDPDLTEDERKQRFDKVIDLITTMKGAIIELDEWGNKRLAYEIKNKTRGHYLRIDYCGTGEMVAEIERNCRIDDKFLKFMTIILQDKADPEKIKVELAEARAKKAAEEASRAEAAKNEEKKFASDDDDDDENFEEESDESNEEEE